MCALLFVLVWYKCVFLCVSPQYLARAECELCGQLWVHPPAPRLAQRAQVRAPKPRRHPRAPPAPARPCSKPARSRPVTGDFGSFPLPASVRARRNRRRDRRLPGRVRGDMCSKSDNAGGEDRQRMRMPAPTGGSAARREKA